MIERIYFCSFLCGTCTFNWNFTDCSSIDEGIEVENINDDDNLCWESTTEKCFSCLNEVKPFYEEYSLRKDFWWNIISSRKRGSKVPKTCVH